MNDTIASIAEKTRMTDRMMRRSDGFQLVTEAQIELFAQEIVRECIKELGQKSAVLLDAELCTHYQESLRARFEVNP